MSHIYPVNKRKNPAGKNGNSRPSGVDITVDDSGIYDAFKRPAPPKPVSSKAPASGATRAAKLLLALGPDQASVVLKELSELEIERIVTEMFRIQRLSPDEKREILMEFHQTAGIEGSISGGPEKAREILAAGLGEKRADEILERMNRGDLRQDFAFLEQLDPPVLSSVLALEHPQIAAVALSYISPKIAAAIMKLFPDTFRTEVALRIAKTSKIHPEAIARVARVLREKFEKRTDETFSDIGGASALANILNHMDRSTEDGILNILGSQAPDVLEDVKGMLYTFEEILNLSAREMRILLSRVNDDQIIAAALRGAGEEMRRHFFNSLSQNRGADILEEMDRRGPLSLREINEARAYVLSVARKLDEEGAIVIKKNKEEYI